MPPLSLTRAASAPQREVVGRREVLAGAAAIAWAPTAVFASGGATAGKTTSIPRAKVRYYGRMAQVLYAYQILGAAINSGDAAAIKAAKKTFWADVEDGPANEMKAAGYLLAVAFKIDSKIPPDKIQAVKDWKKMMGDVDKLKGASAKEAPKAYATATASVNAYLDAVELPALGDKRYDHPETACFFKCEDSV